MSEIGQFVKHIIRNPGADYPEDIFCMGEWETEYSSTECRKSDIRGKEHKLWTPRKDGKHRCFLILEMDKDGNVRITHCLETPEQLLESKRTESWVFLPPQTLASRAGGSDQFEGTIKVPLTGDGNQASYAQLAETLIAITDETVKRRLHMRG